MGKRRIFALGLTLAVGTIAVWSARGPLLDRGESASLAEKAPQALPAPADDPPQEQHDTPDHSAEANVGAAGLSQPPSAGPVRLFSNPDYGSREYQNAWDAASKYLAQDQVRNLSNAQLIKRDDAAISELVKQLAANSDRLGVAIQVSPPGIRECTISSVGHKVPQFTSGVMATPDEFRVETTCDESGDRVSVYVEKGLAGTVSITVYSRLGAVSIYSIDDSGYAVALQYYPEPPPVTMPGDKPPMR